jgi:hypothetical protein
MHRAFGFPPMALCHAPVLLMAREAMRQGLHPICPMPTDANMPMTAPWSQRTPASFQS